MSGAKLIPFPNVKKAESAKDFRCPRCESAVPDDHYLRFAAPREMRITRVEYRVSFRCVGCGDPLEMTYEADF